MAEIKQDQLYTSKVVSRGFEEASQSMVILNRKGSVVLASDGAGVILGLARRDLVGKAFADFFVPPNILDECLQFTKDGGCELMQAQIQHSQGEIHAVELRCQPYTTTEVDGNGDLQTSEYLLLYMTDIRTREHEDEMRAARLAKLSLLNQVSEALYGAHLTLDQILEAVLICMTAGQGLRFNRAFLLLIDEKKEALQGELAIGPSNADEASRIWQDLADQPGDLFEMMTQYDSSIKKTDVAVNEIVRNISIPLSDSDNVLIRSMHNRQALHISHDLVMPGLESIRHMLGCQELAIAPLTTRRGPLGVIAADNAISKSEITHLDLEFLQVFANQSAGAIENSRLYHELEKRLLDLRKAHQKQQEDQETLLRMERLSVMGETSAIVAHELRNPLVAIGGFARTLVRSLAEDDPNRQFANIITEEVGRLETIIHDLLDFIRPQKLMRKTVIIDTLVGDSVGKFRDELAASKIELIWDMGADGQELMCHPGEIQQVLQNFVINSMQVLQHGGELIVRTRILDGGVKVEILDNGPGFADEVGEQLFSPFFSTKPTGSGLGLTICSQIIKAHGGVLGAENRSEGGAAFYFILPLPKKDVVV